MQREEAAQDEGNDALKGQWIKIAGVTSAYWLISFSMVFLNKYLLSSEDLKLEAPLFITLSQCVIAVVCLLCLGAASRYVSYITFPALELDLLTAMKVMPLSILFVGEITFSNLTLKHLGVAFYPVGRSLTTVFTVVLSYAVLSQSISKQVLACCGVIVFGFLLGVKEEDTSVQISFFGVACGILASLCVALCAIFTKRTLSIFDNNVLQLQLYNNANAVLLLAPLMVICGEIPILRNFMFWSSPSFWGLLCLAGLFGIAIGYVAALQIQVSSPVTHNVSGTAKAGVQTVLACVVYSQSKPLWWWFSNVLVLGGSSAYTCVRMSEMKNNENEGGGGRGGQGETLEMIESGRVEPKKTEQ